MGAFYGCISISGKGTRRSDSLTGWQPPCNPQYKWKDRSTSAGWVTALERRIPDTDGYAQNADGFTIVAGTPLYDDGSDAVLGAQDSTEALHRLLSTRSVAALANTRGTFTVCHHNSHSSIVATDSLGIRPVYWSRIDDLLFFASAMRVLLAILPQRLTVDRTGVVEIGSYVALGDQTAFNEIKCLRPGEALVVEKGTLRQIRYIDWASIARGGGIEVIEPQALYDEFLSAVKIRLNGASGAISFLSGGLDSRCIVSALKSCCTTVSTCNFAAVNSADFVLGQMAAKAIGTHHFECALGWSAFGSRPDIAHAAWLESPEFRPNEQQRPRLIWSGDGGSVVLGHVYMTPAIVAKARNAGLREALPDMISHNYWHVPESILQPSARAQTMADVQRAYLQEFNGLDKIDAGRALHVFLLLTDQHRHLHGFFETVHLRSFDMLLPFFDRQFMSAVVLSKVDPFLLHGYYNEWLKCFPPPVIETPWQAYPGHAPSKTAWSGDLIYQWSAEAGSRFDRAAAAARNRRLLKWTFSRRFPTEILSRTRVFAAVVATWLGLKNLTSITRFAEYIRDDLSAAPNLQRAESPQEHR